MLRFSSINKSYFLIDIEKETLNNSDYRRVLFTTKDSQLVVMSLKPGEDIGLEKHDVDQFFRFESGSGKCTIGDTTHAVSDGISITVPKNTKHNILNDSDKDLKMYTIYSPPQHRLDTVNATKEEAVEQPFDGQTNIS